MHPWLLSFFFCLLSLPSLSFFIIFIIMCVRMCVRVCVCGQLFRYRIRPAFYLETVFIVYILTGATYRPSSNLVVSSMIFVSFPYLLFPVLLSNSSHLHYMCAFHL
ncbi:hypothetical protein F4775DRAFT_559892, partial [Biscogniauxia sp. FL1348]